MESMIEKIETLCKSKNISIAKMSRHLDLSHAVFRQWKNTRQKPALESIIKVAKYFNVSIDWLVGLTDNPEINK